MNLERVQAMHCRNYREWISADADGMLSASQARRLREHLAVCPACREFRAEMERTLALLRALPPETPPPDLAAGVRRRLAASSPAGQPFFRIWIRPQTAVLVAAAILLIVAIHGYLPPAAVSPANAPDLPAESVRAPAPVAAPLAPEGHATRSEMPAGATLSAPESAALSEPTAAPATQPALTRLARPSAETAPPAKDLQAESASVSVTTLPVERRRPPPADRPAETRGQIFPPAPARQRAETSPVWGDASAGHALEKAAAAAPDTRTRRSAPHAASAPPPATDTPAPVIRLVVTTADPAAILRLAAPYRSEPAPEMAGRELDSVGLEVGAAGATADSARRVLVRVPAGEYGDWLKKIAARGEVAAAPVPADRVAQEKTAGAFKPDDGRLAVEIQIRVR